MGFYGLIPSKLSESSLAFVLYINGPQRCRWLHDDVVLFFVDIERHSLYSYVGNTNLVFRIHDFECEMTEGVSGNMSNDAVLFIDFNHVDHPKRTVSVAHSTANHLDFPFALFNFAIGLDVDDAPFAFFAPDDCGSSILEDVDALDVIRFHAYEFCIVLIAGIRKVKIFGYFEGLPIHDD